MIDRHRLQLGVVTAAVNDDLIETGLQIGDRLQLELLPLVARNLRAGNNHPVQQDVIR